VHAVEPFFLVTVSTEGDMKHSTLHSTLHNTVLENSNTAGSMSETTRNDIVDVRGGGNQRGKGVKARSSTPIVGAGLGPEDGEGVKW
jgi:hypothetical protein